MKKICDLLFGVDKVTAKHLCNHVSFFYESEKVLIYCLIKPQALLHTPYPSEVRLVAPLHYVRNVC